MALAYGFMVVGDPENSNRIPPKILQMNTANTNNYFLQKKQTRDHSAIGISRAHLIGYPSKYFFTGRIILSDSNQHSYPHPPKLIKWETYMVHTHFTDNKLTDAL